MITFPNCKINLGLHILSKRGDGYHNLETVFVPVPFEDCLEMEKAQGDASLVVSGLVIDGPVENNLCWKAYAFMKEKFQLPALDIRLHKQIPSGAGLGGGSSDAAFSLKLLNEKFRLGLSQIDLLEFAAALGSDCPFFIYNIPCIGRGRGEELEPISISSLNGLFGILVLSPIHISSAWAFHQIKPQQPAESLQTVLQKPIQRWREELVNDFENSVFAVYPELKEIKDQLYNAGALYASMSGSGSAMYGLFDKLPEIKLNSSYTLKSFAFKKEES